MLVCDNGDAIRGIAEVATKLDFIVNGYVGVVATQLSDGQLGTGEANLYLSGADATVVTSITIVNTDSAARTFTLYLKPSGGTSRAITPVSLDLGVGHSFYTDGQRITVLDKLGQVLSTWAVDDTPVNGETDKPISSNWAYDHKADIDAHISGATSRQLLVATGAGTAVWKNADVTLTSPTINGTIATTGLTLPTFTAGGNIVMANNSVIGLTGIYAAPAIALEIQGIRTNNDACIYVRTSGAPAGYAATLRLLISGRAATAVATWSNITHTGIVLSGALTLNAQDLVMDTTTGTKIGTATNQKLAFFGDTPIVQLAKASYGNWASLSDVVNALVAIGLFDVA